MRRRDFITLVGGAAAAWPLAARAQQPPMPLIGFLRSTEQNGTEQLVSAFLQGLNESGYVERQNVAIEYRWGNDDAARLPDLAADLVGRQVAVIVANGVAVKPAMAATTTIPIVFVIGIDPVRSGLVSSLNRPGGNVTGVSILTTEDLHTKRLEILHALVPQTTVVAALLDPNFVESEILASSIEASRSRYRSADRDRKGWRPTQIRCCVFRHKAIRRRRLAGRRRGAFCDPAPPNRGFSCPAGSSRDLHDA